MVNSQEIAQHSIWRSDGSSTDPASQGNKICIRDTDVFYACGNVVRCASLLEHSTRAYKTLDIPIIDFEIVELSLNKPKDIMLIIGKRRLFNCHMPTRSVIEATSPLGAIQVKCQEIDPYNNSSDILKVLWNPISRYNTNVVVLRDDQYLRAFEIVENLLIPDLEMSVSPERSDADMADISVEFLVGDISEFGSPNKFVSMAFGSDAIANGPFTLYLLANNGDIFAVCPWAPALFVLTKEVIERSYDSAVTSEHESRNEKMGIQRMFMSQAAWFTQVYCQLSLSTLETHIEEGDHRKSVDYYIFKRPSKRLLPSLQGPLLIQPYPEELYLDQDGAEACDIVNIPITDGADLTALLVAFSNGNMFTLLQDKAIPALWQNSMHDENGRVTNSLILLNSSYLVNSGNGHTIKFLDLPYSAQRSGITYALVDTNSLYQVDISDWLTQLQHLIEECLSSADGVELDTGSFYDSLKTPSSAYSLLLQRQQGPFCGFFISAFDDIQGECATAVSGTGIKIFKISKGDRNEKELIEMAQQISELGDGLDGLNLGVAYNSAILLYPFEKEVDELLKLDLKLPEVRIDPSQYIGATYRSMESFVQLADSFSGEMNKLLKASILIKRRLAIQKNELRRQIHKATLIKESVAELTQADGFNSISKDRVEKIVERQKKLDVRAQTLLDKLSVTRALPLSDREKAWAEDLVKIEEQIDDLNNGIETRTRKLSDQSRMIINELWLRKDSQINTKSSDGSRSAEHEQTYNASDLMGIQKFLGTFNIHVEGTKDRLDKALLNADIPNYA